MNWVIKVEDNDQNLQHTLYRKDKDDELGIYKHTVKVMRSTDSMSRARLVILDNEKQQQDEYSQEKITEEDSYTDHITLKGECEDEILTGSRDLITVIKRASFNVTKIVSDSKELIEAFDEVVRYPIMNEIIEDKEGSGTQKVLIQLGTKYRVEVKEN